MSKGVFFSIIILIGASMVGAIIYLRAERDATSPEVNMDEQAEEINGATETSENAQTEELVIVPPIGWKMYTDEGLGFSFWYPPDWELAPYKTLPEQQRTERIELRKGEAQILIDPLGRLGSDEFSSSVEQEDVLISENQWRHIYWPEGKYHRYIDTSESLILKIDPTTDGIDAFGNPYTQATRKKSFRAHLNLRNVVDESMADESVTILVEILQTLTKI